MTREQTTIKLPETEIPIRAFDEPGFWVLILLLAGLFIWWKGRR